MSSELERLTETITRLEAELEVAREATSVAMRRAGSAEAERKVLADRLAAAEAAQAEWTELVGHIERERVVAAEQAAELKALRASTTWKIGDAAMSPYRWYRNVRDQ